MMRYNTQIKKNKINVILLTMSCFVNCPIFVIVDNEHTSLIPITLS